jgi:putative hydrolase of the HAD superfamily
LKRAARHRIDQFREVLREPRPEVRSLLAVLRDRGLRLGLISDCSGETPIIWPDLVWTAPIQGAVFSWSERARKPDPRLYRRAAERLQLDCTECLYLGDGGSQELSGAEAVGMHAYQLLALRADGDRLLQYDPDPNWNGPTLSTLTEVLPLLPA